MKKRTPAEFLCFLSLLVALACIGAEEQTVETSAALGVFLVNDRAELVTTLRMPKDKPPNNIIFKHSGSEDFENYDGWALEVTDPAQNLSYRLGVQGKLPSLLHWDGMFNALNKISVNQKYLFRLLLTTKEEKVIASPWAFFITRIKRPYEKPRMTENTISLYVVPTGGVSSVLLRTKSFQAGLFPTIYADARLIWKDIHTLGLRFETSSNAIFQSERTSAGFFYSDFSLFYRYRFFGSPLRSPLLPVVPQYGKPDTKEPRFRIEVFSPPENLEVGARLFNSMLRGFGNTVIEYELMRAVQGAAATVHYDRLFSRLRLFGGAELGYSFFRGKVLLASLEGAVTYERFRDVSPGLQVRYQRFSGHPFQGEPNASVSVTNQMVFGGVILYFKI